MLNLNYRVRIKAYGTHQEAVNVKYSLIETNDYIIDENTGVIHTSSSNYNLNTVQTIRVNFYLKEFLL